MTVGVTNGEIQPVRHPLGQGRLQAVVIGTGKVIYEVNILQIIEFGGVLTVAVAVRIWSTLILVVKSKQVSAVIADVANLQREVAAEGVLDIEVVIHDEGGFEIRIQRHEAALRGGRAREPAIRKNGAGLAGSTRGPVETRACCRTAGGGGREEGGLAEIDRAGAG